MKHAEYLFVSIGYSYFMYTLSLLRDTSYKYQLYFYYQIIYTWGEYEVQNVLYVFHLELQTFIIITTVKMHYF